MGFLQRRPPLRTTVGGAWAGCCLTIVSAFVPMVTPLTSVPVVSARLGGAAMRGIPEIRIDRGGGRYPFGVEGRPPVSGAFLEAADRSGSVRGLPHGDVRPDRRGERIAPPRAPPLAKPQARQTRHEIELR